MTITTTMDRDPIGGATPRAPHMPLGMNRESVALRWPGALEALPTDVDRLSVDCSDGDLWLVHRDGSERVWWEDTQTWSPASRGER